MWLGAAVLAQGEAPACFIHSTNPLTQYHKRNNAKLKRRSHKVPTGWKKCPLKLSGQMVAGPAWIKL